MGAVVYGFADLSGSITSAFFLDFTLRFDAFFWSTFVLVISAFCLAGCFISVLGTFLLILLVEFAQFAL